jgi:LEA14-like dessication related protein
MKKYILGAIAIGVPLYFGAYFANQYRLIKKICIQFIGVQIIQFNFQRVEFNLRLQVKNKSDLDLNIRNQDYDIFVNDSQVAKIQKVEQVTVPPQGSTVVDLPTSFDPMMLLTAAIDNITDILYNKDNIRVNVKGKMQANTSYIFYNSIPIDLHTTVGKLLQPAEQKC